MSQQRLFHIPISNKFVDILKVYTHFFSLFFTFQAFLISCFVNGFRTHSMSKKKRKKLHARFMILITFGGVVLLSLTLGAFVSKKNLSSLLTDVPSTNSLKQSLKRLKNVSVVKVFDSDHIGALSYQWFN